MKSKTKILLALGVLMAFAISLSAMASTVTIRPDGSGYYGAWTKTSCTYGWDCVDETPASTTDYLSTQSTSTKATFTFGSTGLSGVTINSVTLYYYAKRYSASKYNIRPLIRSGGTDYFGTVVALGSGYAYKSQTYTTNPATGNAWTLAEVEALEAGMNTYTTKAGGYVAQVYAVVDYSPASDLIIYSIEFNEFSYNESSGIEANVTTTVKNIGTEATGTYTYVGTSHLGGGYSLYVPSLGAGQTYKVNVKYNCEYGHTYGATADHTSRVIEIDETNNYASAYIDCII